jgi:hypothetical protein
MQTATTALTQYAAICSATQRVSYGQAAQRARRGAALTVVPQLACVATSSVGRGRFLAFLQASDQKVEDIVAAQVAGERDSVTGVSEDSDLEGGAIGWQRWLTREGQLGSNCFRKGRAARRECCHGEEEKEEEEEEEPPWRRRWWWWWTWCGYR